MDNNGEFVSIWGSFYGIDGYYDGFEYGHRDNPCFPAYYNYDRFVRRNVLASDIGIIAKGGKRLMDLIKRVDKQANIISTKKLTTPQTELFHKKVSAKSNDFIQVSTNRISPQVFKQEIENVVITSKNGVESIVLNAEAESIKFKNIYCVGRRTKRMIEQKIGPVTHSEKNAKSLANYLVENLEGNKVTYFCSDLRLDDLPTILRENGFEVNEVIAYTTKYNSQKVDDAVEGVMFYSPSTVKSFMQSNNALGIAFCIGESTAREAKKHFENVRISKVPTVESVIELVNDNYV